MCNIFGFGLGSGSVGAFATAAAAVAVAAIIRGSETCVGEQTYSTHVHMHLCTI